MSIASRFKALFTARRAGKSDFNAAVSAIVAERDGREVLTAPVKKLAALQEAELLVAGVAVPEPLPARRSTNASRRHEAAKRDRRNTTAVPTAYGLNRAQRRALGLHKVDR